MLKLNSITIIEIEFIMILQKPNKKYLQIIYPIIFFSEKRFLKTIYQLLLFFLNTKKHFFY